VYRRFERIEGEINELAAERADLERRREGLYLNISELTAGYQGDTPRTRTELESNLTSGDQKNSPPIVSTIDSRIFPLVPSQSPLNLSRRRPSAQITVDPPSRILEPPLVASPVPIRHRPDTSPSNYFDVHGESSQESRPSSENTIHIDPSDSSNVQNIPNDSRVAPPVVVLPEEWEEFQKFKAFRQWQTSQTGAIPLLPPT
jgi:hypothetical protein